MRLEIAFRCCGQHLRRAPVRDVREGIEAQKRGTEAAFSSHHQQQKMSKGMDALETRTTTPPLYLQLRYNKAKEQRKQGRWPSPMDGPGAAAAPAVPRSQAKPPHAISTHLPRVRGGRPKPRTGVEMRVSGGKVTAHGGPLQHAHASQVLHAAPISSVAPPPGCRASGRLHSIGPW